MSDISKKLKELKFMQKTARAPVKADTLGSVVCKTNVFSFPGAVHAKRQKNS